MKITIHQIAKVANGYEYFYSVFGDNGKVIFGNRFHFCGKNMPSEKAQESWVTEEKAYITNMLYELETVNENEFLQEYADKAFEKKLISEPTKEKLRTYIDSKIHIGVIHG